MIHRLLACIFLLSVPVTPELGSTLTAPPLPTPVIQCVDDSTKELKSAQQAVASSSECNDLVHYTLCKAVLGMNLTLVCPVCQNHSVVKWKHSNSSVQLSSYTSYNITLQANLSVANGCYTCECMDDKLPELSCKFPTEVRPKVVPYLKVPNCSEGGQIQLCSDCSSNCPASHSMSRSSTGTLSVNCSSDGWPTPDVSFSVSYNGETHPLASASVPGLCFKSTDSTVDINVTRDFGSRLQGVEVLCHVGNIFGQFDAISQIVFDGWHDFFITSLVDTSTQPQVNYLHDGVGSAVCGGYSEDDIQFSYQLCMMNPHSRTSDDVCEASLECCDCLNCTNLAMLSATGITSLAHYDAMGRQVCSFNVSREARLVCMGRRDNVVDSVYQSLSAHEIVEVSKEKQPIVWCIPVAGSLGGLLVALVVVLFGCMVAVFQAKRQKGNNVKRVNKSGVGEHPNEQQSGQGSDIEQQRLLSSEERGMFLCSGCLTSELKKKVKFIDTMTKKDIAVCPSHPDEMGRMVLKPGLYHLEAHEYKWEVDVPGTAPVTYEQTDIQVESILTKENIQIPPISTDEERRTEKKLELYREDVDIGVPGRAPVSPALRHVPFSLKDVSDYVDRMALKWSQLGYKLNMDIKVATLRHRQAADEDKCLQIIESAVDEGKLKSWDQLLEILRSDAMKMSALAQRIEAEMSEKYGRGRQDDDSDNDVSQRGQETNTS